MPVKPVKYEPVYIWITFLGLGIPFKDGSLIIPAEVGPMKSGLKEAVSILE